MNASTTAMTCLIDLQEEEKENIKIKNKKKIKNNKK